MRHNFKNLKIWQEGIALVAENYRLTNDFPDSEKFGLVNQMNRAAVSIPSNIAEGTAKSSDKHFNIYLENALGSAFEWETQLIIASRLNVVGTDKFEKLEEQIQGIQRMISSFINKLNA